MRSEHNEQAHLERHLADAQDAHAERHERSQLDPYDRDEDGAGIGPSVTSERGRYARCPRCASGIEEINGQVVIYSCGSERPDDDPEGDYSIIACEVIRDLRMLADAAARSVPLEASGSRAEQLRLKGALEVMVEVYVGGGYDARARLDADALAVRTLADLYPGNWHNRIPPERRDSADPLTQHAIREERGEGQSSHDR